MYGVVLLVIVTIAARVKVINRVDRDNAAPCSLTCLMHAWPQAETYTDKSPVGLCAFNYGKMVHPLA